MAEDKSLHDIFQQEDKTKFILDHVLKMVRRGDSQKTILEVSEFLFSDPCKSRQIELNLVEVFFQPNQGNYDTMEIGDVLRINKYMGVDGPILNIFFDKEYALQIATELFDFANSK